MPHANINQGNARWQRVAISVLLMSLIFYAGCDSTPAPTGEWLVTIPGMTEPTESSPCQGSQWDGITFRETTEAELVTWFETSSMVDQTSLTDAWDEPLNDPPYHYYSWLVQTGSLERSVFNIREDTVYSFYAPVMYPLTLEQMVTRWGEPGYVAAYVECRSETDCLYTYDMGYPALGMMVLGEFVQNNLYEMLEEDAAGKDYGPWQGDFPVTYVYCGKSGDLETLIENVYVTDNEDTVTHISKRFRPWPGWGQIELFDE